MSRARDVVEVIARELASRPDDVVVSERERRDQTVVELSMAPGDLGRVIGRQGRTATAVRTLAAAAGELDGLKVVVDFQDEQASGIAVEWASMVNIGRIVRPHGNRGQVVIVPESDFAEERFRPGAHVHVFRNDAVETLEVTAGRLFGGRWIVGLAGVTSIDAAETLRGLEVRIPEDALRVLGPGAFYVHDLVGCEVRTAGGERVGNVERVDLATGVPVLVVAGRDEVLVPFVDAICTRVDPAARVIEIDPPDGLLTLNPAPRPR